MLIQSRKGQSTAEYAILFALVVAAAMGVQSYVKRSLQTAIKERADMFVEAVTEGRQNSQWEAVTGTKTTTGQESTRTFTENAEDAEAPYKYIESSSADYTSNTRQ